MTETNIENYILGLEPEKLEEEQLQEVYKTVRSLQGKDTDIDYETWNKNELKYKIACNIFYLNKDNKEFLYKACEFNDSIEITEKDSSMVGDLNFYLRTQLLGKLTELSDQESLNKAYDILNQISENHEGISIENLNTLRYNLFVTYCHLGDQESLNKAYNILNQISQNPEGVAVKEVIQLTEGLLNKYCELDKEKNKEQIKNLKNELKNLKEEEEKVKKYILEFNPKTATEEELRSMYIEIVKLCRNDARNYYETWSKNELIYEMIDNILYFYRNNKEFLYKACEFNDLVDITKEDSSIVRGVNVDLRKNLFKELIEFGDQESLDKAYHILFDQLLPNPEGITVKKAIQLTEGLLDKYHKLDEKTNENEIKNLKNELKNLKEEEEKVKKYILGLNPETATDEELQDVYVKTTKLCGDIIDNNCYKTWSKNKLMYEVACNINILYLDRNNKEFLYKACEFNDLIEEDSSIVRGVNVDLRKNLFKELIEYDDQESLDKVYHILFEQILPNLEDIIVKKLNYLKYYLIISYLELNTQEYINRAKEVFNSIDLGTVGDKLNDYIELQHKILRTEAELHRINIQENGENTERNIEEEIVDAVVNQTFEEERQRAQDDLYTLDNIETNISKDQTIESFIDSLKTEEGRKYLIESLFVRYFTDPFMGNLPEEEQRKIEEFIKLSKEYFLDENKEIKGIKIYDKIADLIFNSNAVSEYATDIVLESMNYSSNIGIVIDMINAGNDLNKMKEKSVSTMFEELVIETLKKKVSEQEIKDEERNKQTNPRITTTEDLQQQSSDLSSMDEEFDMVEAEQQATTLNEDIDNYGSVTNEFSDETEEEVTIASRINYFQNLINTNQGNQTNSTTNNPEQRQRRGTEGNNTHNSRYSNEATRNAFNIARGLFQDL